MQTFQLFQTLQIAAEKSFRSIRLKQVFRKQTQATFVVPPSIYQNLLDQAGLSYINSDQNQQSTLEITVNSMRASKAQSPESITLLLRKINILRRLSTVKHISNINGQHEYADTQTPIFF